jgi:hypothetical protein
MTTSRLLTVAWLAGAVTAWGASAPAAEIDRCLPEDAHAFVTVNVKQLLHAPVVKKHAAKPLEQFCQGPPIRAVLDGLGLDPLKDVDRVTAACTGPDDKGLVVVCRGRFDTAKFHAFLRKAAKDDAERVKVRKAGEWKCYEIVGPGKHGSLLLGSGVNSDGAPTFAWKQTGSLLDTLGTAYVTLADKNTLVLAPSLDGLATVCRRATGAAEPSQSTALGKLLEDFDGKQTVCFAAHGSLLKGKLAGEAAGEEQEEGPQVEGVSGGLTVNDGVQVRCALTAADADGARELLKALDDLRTRAAGMAVVLAGNQKKYAFLKEVPKAFGATRKGATIFLEGRLSADLLDKLAGLGKKDD